jgi:hypothetical protein
MTQCDILFYDYYENQIKYKQKEISINIVKQKQTRDECYNKFLECIKIKNLKQFYRYYNDYFKYKDENMINEYQFIQNLHEDNYYNDKNEYSDDIISFIDNYISFMKIDKDSTSYNESKIEFYNNFLNFLKNNKIFKDSANNIVFFIKVFLTYSIDEINKIFFKINDYFLAFFFFNSFLEVYDIFYIIQGKSLPTSELLSKINDIETTYDGIKNIINITIKLIKEEVNKNIKNYLLTSYEEQQKQKEQKQKQQQNTTIVPKKDYSGLITLLQSDNIKTKEITEDIFNNVIDYIGLQNYLLFELKQKYNESIFIEIIPVLGNIENEYNKIIKNINYIIKTYYKLFVKSKEESDKLKFKFDDYLNIIYNYYQYILSDKTNADIDKLYVIIEKDFINKKKQTKNVMSILNYIYQTVNNKYLKHILVKIIVIVHHKIDNDNIKEFINEKEKDESQDIIRYIKRSSSKTENTENIEKQKKEIDYKISSLSEKIKIIKIINSLKDCKKECKNNMNDLNEFLKLLGLDLEELSTFQYVYTEILNSPYPNIIKRYLIREKSLTTDSQEISLKRKTEPYHDISIFDYNYYIENAPKQPNHDSRNNDNLRIKELNNSLIDLNGLFNNYMKNKKNKEKLYNAFIDHFEGKYTNNLTTIEEIFKIISSNKKYFQLMLLYILLNIIDLFVNNNGKKTTFTTKLLNTMKFSNKETLHSTISENKGLIKNKIKEIYNYFNIEKILEYEKLANKKKILEFIVTLINKGYKNIPIDIDQFIDKYEKKEYNKDTIINILDLQSIKYKVEQYKFIELLIKEDEKLLSDDNYEDYKIFGGLKYLDIDFIILEFIKNNPKLEKILDIKTLKKCLLKTLNKKRTLRKYKNTDQVFKTKDNLTNKRTKR